MIKLAWLAILLCFLLGLVVQTEQFRIAYICTAQKMHTIYWDIHNLVADCPCIAEFNEANAILKENELSKMNQKQIETLLGKPDHICKKEELFGDLKADETWTYSKKNHLCLYFLNKDCISAIPHVNAYQGVCCFSHTNSTALAGMPTK